MNDAIQVEALNNLKNSNSVKQISSDSIGSNQTNNNLISFINDNSVLKGDEWNNVRSKLSKYNSLFNKRAKVASALSSSINSAVKLLLDYLGDDLYLDVSKLEEIKNTKLRCEQLISDLENKLNSVEEVEEVDESGNVIYKTDYVYSFSEREEFKKMIAELNDVTIPELNKLINKIEGLPLIYEEAESMIRDAYNEIVNFNNEVNLITPSSKVQFTTL